MSSPSSSPASETAARPPGPVREPSPATSKPKASRKRSARTPPSRAQNERQEQLPFRPADGSDRPAWDRYYRHVISQDPADAQEKTDAGSLGVARLAALAEDLKAQDWTRVWVPGCGLSPMASVLAEAGLDVLATDISATAIIFQQQRAESEGIAARFFVRDPRTAPPAKDFDLLLVRDLPTLFEGQGLQAVCEALHDALLPERTAVFDIGPADTRKRRHLEAALHDAGFHVPLYQLRQEYLGALVDSGLPHTLVMDRPTLRRTGRHAKDSDARQEASQRLRQIYDDYLDRRPEAEAADLERFGPTSRLAEILYAEG